MNFQHQPTNKKVCNVIFVCKIQYSIMLFFQLTEILVLNEIQNVNRNSYRDSGLNDKISRRLKRTTLPCRVSRHQLMFHFCCGVIFRMHPVYDLSYDNKQNMTFMDLIFSNKRLIVTEMNLNKWINLIRVASWWSG